MILDTIKGSAPTVSTGSHSSISRLGHQASFSQSHTAMELTCNILFSTGITFLFPLLNHPINESDILVGRIRVIGHTQHLGWVYFSYSYSVG